jgi:hypothetical protein
MIAEEIMQVSEIASDKGKPFVIHNVLFCVLVLVEAEKTDAFISLTENFFRVSTTAEGDIHIDASRLKVHAVNAFVQQDGYVICLFFV